MEVKRRSSGKQALAHLIQRCATSPEMYTFNRREVRMYPAASAVPFDSIVDNVEPKLVELSLSTGQGSPLRSATIVCDLRFSQSRQELRDVTVYCGISHAEVSVHAIPPDFSARSRYADSVNRGADEVERTTSRKRSQGTKARATAKARLSPATLFGQIGMELEKEKAAASESAEVVKSKRIQPPIRARGNMTWAVGQHSDLEPLEGRYVGNDTLCIADSAKDFIELEVRVTVPRMTFVVDKVTDKKTGNEIIISKGKKAIVDALARKSLSKSGDALIMCSGKLTPNGK